MIYPFALTFGPELEGRFFPVSEKAIISKITKLNDFQTQIEGKVFKNRDCEFITVEWHLISESGSSVIVPVKFDRASRINMPGPIEFGPWSLNIDEESALLNTKAYALHNCHPFWITKTRFW